VPGKGTLTITFDPAVSFSQRIDFSEVLWLALRHDRRVYYDPKFVDRVTDRIEIELHYASASNVEWIQAAVKQLAKENGFGASIHLALILPPQE
jgi:hypothetical protein